MTSTSIKLAISAVVLAFATTAHAGVVFQTNFDSYCGAEGVTCPDWTSDEVYPINLGYPGTQAAPGGFDAYREGSPQWSGASKHHVISGGPSAEGDTGKGLTINQESTAFGVWAGGGFFKYLGWPGYQRLFVRFSMKLPSNFCWQNANSVSSGNGKIMRVTATRRPLENMVDSPARYPSADNSPSSICNWYPRVQKNRTTLAPTGYDEQPIVMMESRLAPDYAHMTDAQGSNCGDAACFPTALFPSDADAGAVTTTAPYAPIVNGSGLCGDGKWHQYEYEHWMNSAPGVSDGGYRVYKDGTLWASKTDIPWVMAGTDARGLVMSTDSGWNSVWLPDNHNLFPWDISEQKSMPFYMDNIVMYSPISAGDPLWATSPQDGRLPLSYAIGGVVPDPNPTIPSSVRFRGQHLYGSVW